MISKPTTATTTKPKSIHFSMQNKQLECINCARNATKVTIFIPKLKIFLGRGLSPPRLLLSVGRGHPPHTAPVDTSPRFIHFPQGLGARIITACHTAHPVWHNDQPKCTTATG